MSDVEAWQELCDLYLSQGEYPKAVFCAEELLLHQPHSHLFYQRVADIRYTMVRIMKLPLRSTYFTIATFQGGVENMELAKTYYCQAIQLNAHNMRAHVGLFLACNNLLTHYKAGSSGRKKCTQLANWACSHIKGCYQSLGSIQTLDGPKKRQNENDYIEDIADSLSALTVA
jgi:ER membrane protein complex subunit 2